MHGRDTRRKDVGKLVPSRRCTATAKRTGERCRSYAYAGAKTCLRHGVNPTVRKKADRKIQEAHLMKAVATYGLPIDIDPAEALLQEVRRTAGHVAWLAEKVQTLDPDALVWATTRTVDKQAPQYPGSDKTEAATINAWADLYTRERRHLAEVCTAALRAGVDERRVRLAEQQAALIADVIKRILGDLDLTPEQAAKVKDVVPRHLRLVEGTTAA